MTGRLTCVLLASGLLAPWVSQAAGTAAGTSIQNTAQVTYTVAGAPASVASNSTSITVGEIVDVVVTVQTATRQASAGAAQSALVFRVTNTGNATQKIHLTGNSAIVGDNFDPVPATPFIYFDTDASGDLSAADTAYVPGSNDPQLAPDASITVLLVNAIPSTVIDGQHGRSALTATSFVGTGTPGKDFPGAGVGGVDAVVGASGGTSTGTGEYVVQSLALSAVKSQTVVDQFGGNRALPGARITYHIAVTATGTGTATAAQFSDAIPANTTYVANSLKLNGAALTDSADTDAGSYVTTPQPSVQVSLGNLTQASGTQTVEFAVTVN
jgi:uncharacterized repeat protein (TIGR01451 family)